MYTANNQLVGGWTTRFKNMLVKLDHETSIFGVKIKKLFETTTQKIFRWQGVLSFCRDFFHHLERVFLIQWNGDPKDRTPETTKIAWKMMVLHLKKQSGFPATNVMFIYS